MKDYISTENSTYYIIIQIDSYWQALNANMVCVYRHCAAVQRYRQNCLVKSATSHCLI